VSPESTFIPEIWQGHKNEGEGFWIALDRLEDAWLRATQVEETQPRLAALRPEPARPRVPLS